MREAVYNLHVANQKPIATYSKRCVYLNFGQHKPVHQTFIVADIPMPTIGIDLLQHHNLLIDTKSVDGNTELFVCVTSFSGWRSSPVTVRHTIDP